MMTKKIIDRFDALLFGILTEDHKLVSLLLSKKDLISYKLAVKKIISGVAFEKPIKNNNLEEKNSFQIAFNIISSYDSSESYLLSEGELNYLTEEKNILIANFLDKMRGPSLALKFLEQLIEKFSNSFNLLIECAQYAYKVGDLSRCRSYLKIAGTIEPDSVVLVKNIALLETNSRNFERAAKAFSVWYQSEPHNMDPLLGMINAARHEVYFGISEFEKKLLSNIPKSSSLDFMGPFPICSITSDNREALRIAHEKYAKTIIKKIPALSVVKQKITHNKKIKVGYLSGDFHNHATLFLAIEAIIQYNRNEFEVFIYSYGPDDQSEIRNKLQENVDHFFDLKDKSNFDIAKKINSDQIDILVDIKGFTLGSRCGILAHRPAPIQVGWLAYPTTYGSKKLIDYFLADQITVPKENESEFVEIVYRLNCCYQPNDPQRYQPSLKEFDGGPLKLCNFNQFYKLGEAWVIAVGKFLSRHKKITLTMLNHGDSANRRMKSALLQYGATDHQIIFREAMSPKDHLDSISKFDLAIDSFPYTSHTTGSDAVWCGVPLVPACGDTFASRVSTSIYYYAGMPMENIGKGIDGMINHLEYIINKPIYYQSLKEIAMHAKDKILFNSRYFSEELGKFYNSFRSSI